MKPYEKKLYHILRIIMAVVFIYASIDKIMHPHDFARAVFNYQILPDYLITYQWLKKIAIGGLRNYIKIVFINKGCV